MLHLRLGARRQRYHRTTPRRATTASRDQEREAILHPPGQETGLLRASDLWSMYLCMLPFIYLICWFTTASINAATRDHKKRQTLVSPPTVPTANSPPAQPILCPTACATRHPTTLPRQQHQKQQQAPSIIIINSPYDHHHHPTTKQPQQQQPPQTKKTKKKTLPPSKQSTTSTPQTTQSPPSPCATTSPPPSSAPTTTSPQTTSSPPAAPSASPAAPSRSRQHPPPTTPANAPSAAGWSAASVPTMTSLCCI